MDKEDCIHLLLSTLLKPQWKLSNSVTDWDLRRVLWESGVLLAPEQVAALLADMKRRGLVAASERRGDTQAFAMWGIRATPAGTDWVAQRDAAQARENRQPAQPEAPASGETNPDEAAPSGVAGEQAIGGEPRTSEP